MARAEPGGQRGLGEVIDSSDKGEEAEDEESEEDVPEVGADGQPQPDRASSNDLRSSAPTAAGGDQGETNQPPVPPTGAADFAAQPSAAPTGATDSAIQPEPSATQTSAANSAV